MNLPRARWLALVALAPLAWLACNALAGIDEPTVTSPGACVHNQPPAPPKNADTGDARLAFAFHRVSFGDISGPQPKPSAPGYDLDGVCTCPGDPSCKPLLASFPSCDMPGGVDNAFLGLYANFSSFLSMDAVNARLAVGQLGMLLTVAGYNGLPDDPVVDVSFLVGSSLANVADAAVPSWNGTDQWNIDTASYADAGVTKAEDPVAYVAGGVLVAKLPAARLLFPISDQPLRIDVTEAVLTVRISGLDAGVAELTGGQFTGRIPVESLIGAIATLPWLAAPMLCETPAAFESVRAETCKRADILRASGAAAAAPCDALSFVLGFEGVQVSTGVPQVVPQPEAGLCPPGTRFDCVDVDF
jgi:hypothetical protein